MPDTLPFCCCISTANCRRCVCFRAKKTEASDSWCGVRSIGVWYWASVVYCWQKSTHSQTVDDSDDVAAQHGSYQQKYRPFRLLPWHDKREKFVNFCDGNIGPYALFFCFVTSYAYISLQIDLTDQMQSSVHVTLGCAVTARVCAGTKIKRKNAVLTTKT